MSPTLILDPKGRSFMSVGAAGATRIITGVAQVISCVIDYGMNIQDAISAPRVYRTNTTDYGAEGRIPVLAINGLIAMGHKVNIQDYYYPFPGRYPGLRLRLRDQDPSMAAATRAATARQ